MKLEVPRIAPSAELEAKAALLRRLKEAKELRPRGAVAVELTVGRQANRADVVVIDERVRCFEVKSKRDTLTRLDQQVSAFSQVFDEVTVVAATRHVNAALSRVAPHVGVWELVEFGRGIEVREVRPASLSPAINVARMLDLMPAADIKSAFKGMVGRSTVRRQQIVECVEHLPVDAVREALRSFLLRRYGPSTSRFKRAVERRDVAPTDVQRLKVWGAASGARLSDPGTPAPVATGSDWALFNYVGAGFGPVPDDIRALLRTDG